MTTRLLTVSLLAAALTFAGCGGSNVAPFPPAPGPPAGGGDAEAMDVGPMLIRPASTAGFKAEDLGSQGRCALVALYGAQIDYMASQAMLDRIVFSSDRDGFNDIWVCNMDGSGATQITNNGADEYRAQWSHDGTRIVFDRRWPSQDSEIITMEADGSTIRTLTANTADDTNASWSHDSRRIVFDTFRTGNWEIYTMYEDDSSQTNISNHPNADRYPDWGPLTTYPDIAFCSDRDGDYELFTMDADGSGQTQVTLNTRTDRGPAWNPGGYFVALDRWMGAGDTEVFRMTYTGGSVQRLSNDPGTDQSPAWSSNGEWFAFRSDRQGSADIWLQETAEPYSAFRVTKNSAHDDFPDLGSPTVQAERVLIGPPGSDWGGLDPIWSSAYAGVVAFDDVGYRNFVRIGIRAIDVGSLEVTPLMQTSQGGPDLVGVVVEATEIINLREDAGRGYDPTVWDLDPLDAGAALLYFHSYTGKLVSVLAVDDSTYPSAAGARGVAVTQRIEGDRLIVEGDFAAVFDAQGRNLAPDGATQVSLDAEGRAIAVQ